MSIKLIKVGEIAGAHGVQGEVKIFPHCDSVEFLQGFKEFYLDEKKYAVSASRRHKGMLLAFLEGINSRDDVVAILGKSVFINRADADLPEGSFFIEEIIGASVVEENGNKIGTLKEVIDGVSGFIYVVKGKKEHLIPAVPEFVLSTDAKEKIITVRLIEGM